jgi:hypothetical protein
LVSAEYDAGNPKGLIVPKVDAAHRIAGESQRTRDAEAIIHRARLNRCPRGAGLEFHEKIRPENVN